MTTTSHALEDKYNAEDDAKKISKHAQEKEDSKTSLEKLPNPTGWRLLVMPFKVKEETKRRNNYCTRNTRPCTCCNASWIRIEDGRSVLPGQRKIFNRSMV